MSATASTAGARILRNSFWFGLESIIETVVYLLASIAVARYLGPTKLGYYSYINFFVSVVTRTSGAGLSGATRKYMAEFLAQEQPGKARAVYHLAYRYQLLGAVLLTVVGLLAVWLLGDPSYRLVASLLILSIIPGLMSWVPAQANNAFEDAAKNTKSAFGYLIAYVVVIGLTLYFHWDLVGIASATLVGRTVEVLLRTGPLHARLRAMPLEPLEEGTIADLRRFCLEAIGTQMLMTIVWDRSEMLFLKHYSTLEQISFYSISFTLAGNLLVVPRILTGATGITLMVEALRDPTRVDSIVRNSCRYLLLFVFPIYLGAAAIAGQAIRVAYTSRYAAAGPVLMISAILAMPRAFQEIPEVLMRASDRQRQLFAMIAVTGVLNLLLDWTLIPRFGAVGAAWGNGLSQAFGICAFWYKARQVFRFSFPVGAAVRLGLAGTLMGGAAYAIGRTVPGLLGVLASVAVAGPLYVLLVRLFGGLEAGDRVRLAPIGNRLPGAARRAYLAVITFATPAEA